MKKILIIGLSVSASIFFSVDPSFARDDAGAYPAIQTGFYEASKVTSGVSATGDLWFNVFQLGDTLTITGVNATCISWRVPRYFRAIAESPGKYVQVDDPFHSQGTVEYMDSTHLRMTNFAIVVPCSNPLSFSGHGTTLVIQRFLHFGYGGGGAGSSGTAQ